MAALAFTSQAQSDFKMPAPSPTSTIHQDFSTSFIGVEYSRPSVKGRKIFGDFIPYGNLWRTGANAATKLTFGEEVIIGGKKIPAGSYSLYTIPGQKEWTVIINKNTGNWGASGFEEKDDLVRVKVPAEKLNRPVETFTIAVENITPTSSDITLAWETTKISVPVKADNDERIMKWLDNALRSDNPPYQQAANYYLENGKDLGMALEYITKAADANPKGFWLLWTKAEILNKLGKKTEALREAEKAVKLTTGTPYEKEYVSKMKSLK